ncbi:MAG TPA: hypothetical protein VM866_02390 [Pyrinomonadaceae bacterium]|nr:hypothetical protein [Pyrinomonadaceae bacterium]
MITRKLKILRTSLLLLLFGAVCFGAASGQGKRAARAKSEFGPVVRSYLGYLSAQQEVVDDRVSRREVSPDYYRRNSNRIGALRQMAVKIARETRNDYLPELEAVALDELRMLFDEPPDVEALRGSETLNNTFRFLGAIRSGKEKFYLFARLDPFEQTELRKKAASGAPSEGRSNSASAPAGGGPVSRPRRTSAPEN